jgi:hypothetical protein
LFSLNGRVLQGLKPTLILQRLWHDKSRALTLRGFPKQFFASGGIAPFQYDSKGVYGTTEAVPFQDDSKRRHYSFSYAGDSPGCNTIVKSQT